MFNGARIKFMIPVVMLSFSSVLLAQNRSAADSFRAQGNAAVERGDWEHAFEYLQKAQEIDPRNPSTLYALGFAHVKAGHHVTAMFWLQAYLLAKPNAANTATVMEDFPKREAAAKELAQSTFNTAQKMAEKEKLYIDEAFDGVAIAQAEAGHITSALKNGRFQRDTLWESYADFAASAGDFDEAKRALSNTNKAPGEFYAVIAKSVFGPNFPDCPILDYGRARRAIQYITDSARRESASRMVEELVSAREKYFQCSKLDALAIWLGYAKEFRAIDLQKELAPDALGNASFSDPARVPGVIARRARDIHVQLARFQFLQKQLSER